MRPPQSLPRSARRASRWTTPVALAELAGLTLAGLFACRSADHAAPVETRVEPLSPPKVRTIPENFSERAHAPPAAEKTNAASPGSGPTSFRIEGVAAGDVLNIRDEPNAEALLRGAIPSGATHVEGLSTSATEGGGSWQRVRYGGVVGWVNARFLKRNAGGPPPQPPPSSGVELLAPLVCFGSEPDWFLRFGADGSATFRDSSDDPPLALRVAKVAASKGKPASLDLLDPKRRLWSAIVLDETGRCSDGMSDDPYPYALKSGGGTRVLDGCCRVKGKDEL